ncbi:MAG: protein-glutamate O-methyltransferase CheR [Nitrospirae bacterium]|nr:protein-glutamate O-methyltransferase CheR [Nitrospirota bacterium]
MTTMSSLNISLRDETFRQLRDIIYEKSGIFIPDNKKYFLENKLIRRIQEKNFNSFEDYLYLIRYGSNGNELSALFDLVTTNETFFFREPLQFDILFEYILPEISRSKGNNNFKIWSAACSTGEEPYTIVMIKSEKKPDMKIEVYASDISEGVISTAKKGIYYSYSVRNIPETYIKKYFKQNGQGFELDNAIKSSVRFLNINLTDEKKMRSMYDFDVIFCRNVLIYFDDKAKQKVVSLLYNSIRPGGYLITGSTESLHNVTRAFKPVVINKAIVYRRT